MTRWAPSTKGKWHAIAPPGDLANLAIARCSSRLFLDQARIIESEPKDGRPICYACKASLQAYERTRDVQEETRRSVLAALKDDTQI